MESFERSGNPSPGTIVIAGASQGLGASLAELCATRGYPVALIGRSTEKLRLVENALRARGGDSRPGITIHAPEITIHAVDLTDTRASEIAFGEIRSRHPRLRALVNAAGTWIPAQPTAEISREVFQRALDLNFFTALNATRSFLAASKSEGQSLSIVNIGATASLQGWQDVAPFCIAKGALRFYSQSLARELGAQGIHVAHVIIDGLLDNPRTRDLSKDVPDHRFMKQSSVSKAVLSLIEQDPSCWTFELDLRPSHEEW